jgi:hypothetical protein
MREKIIIILIKKINFYFDKSNKFKNFTLQHQLPKII